MAVEAEAEQGLGRPVFVARALFAAVARHRARGAVLETGPARARLKKNSHLSVFLLGLCIQL